MHHDYVYFGNPDTWLFLSTYAIKKFQSTLNHQDLYIFRFDFDSKWNITCLSSRSQLVVEQMVLAANWDPVLPVFEPSNPVALYDLDRATIKTKRKNDRGTEEMSLKLKAVLQFADR